MALSSRPLPRSPNSDLRYYDDYHLVSDLVPRIPYYRPAYPQQANDYDDTAPTMLPAGTFLHKGFYDLLAMIPTPSPSRFLWGGSRSNIQPPPTDGEHLILAPPYKDITPRNPASSPPFPLKKGRRVSKDMVSRPTGFVWVMFSIHNVYPNKGNNLQPPCPRFGCRSGRSTFNSLGPRWLRETRRSGTSALSTYTLSILN